MDEHEPKTLGERIARLRKLRNWTQEELASRIELHPAHVSRIENNKMRPKDSTLERIAEVFGQSPDELEGHSSEELALQDEQLLRAFHYAQQLDADDKRTILKIVQALLTKKRVEQAVKL
jgi:transcriptional regulator with XRE-family HTH domain